MKPNEHIAPFLAEPINLKVGLNHLGYRNAAEDLFTTLLPGLNNVTARIRYYSFYCWLLNKFFESKTRPIVIEYNRFIRYSEYLLAILHTDLLDSSGIPGIAYALNTMQEKPDFVDLKKGSYKTDGSTKGTYWANKGGVLRQYYGNSLHDMGITVPSVKYPEISDISKKGLFITGKILAESFEESVGHEASSLFIRCVQKGRVSEDERKALLPPFTMKSLVSDVCERELLLKMLLQEDYPGQGVRQYRKETIRLFLEFFNEGFSRTNRDMLGFPRYLYERFLHGDRSSPCVTGWYCFFLNDVWQYNTSIILERVLDILQNEKMGRWVKLDELTTEIAVGVTSLFDADTMKLAEVLSSFKSVSSKGNIGIISTALHDVLLYYLANVLIWPSPEDLINLFDYRGVDDFRSATLFIDKYKNLKFCEFVKCFLESKIIYQHYNVSLRKFYQTGISSHKFILEDGFIRYLRDAFFMVSHISPRLITLKGFLADLGLLSEDHLTRQGIETLSSLS